MQTKTDWAKYVLVFIITVLLFVTAGFLSNYFNNKKINELKVIQDRVAIDLLSSETQFSLLEESSCKDVEKDSVLSKELTSLADKISYSERTISSRSEEVLNLKRYYSLLEVKDYLLMKRMAERCKLPSAFILHFYDNEDCEPCVRQWYVLGELRAKYPHLRVYSFDYNLDLSTINTLINIYKIPSEMPTLVLGGKVYSGFQSIEDVERAMPELLIKEEEDKSTASGTKPATTAKPSQRN